MTSAILLTAAELLCGLALVAGFLTRWAAVPMTIAMAIAIVGVHLSSGFFLPDGLEYALTLFGACVALTCLGPGALAIDNWLTAGRIRPAAKTASVERAA
jgi:putative oxidoreductase